MYIFLMYATLNSMKLKGNWVWNWEEVVVEPYMLGTQIPLAYFGYIDQILRLWQVHFSWMSLFFLRNIYFDELRGFMHINQICWCYKLVNCFWINRFVQEKVDPNFNHSTDSDTEKSEDDEQRPSGRGTLV